jgi:ABC-type transporter Mla subunit MlaD
MRKYQYETVAGIFVVIGLLCVAYMTIKLGKDQFFLGDSTYVLYARFTSVSGLRVGNPVEMFGLEVGRIGKMELDQKGFFISSFISKVPRDYFILKKSVITAPSERNGPKGIACLKSFPFLRTQRSRNSTPFHGSPF